MKDYYQIIKDTFVSNFNEYSLSQYYIDFDINGCFNNNNNSKIVYNKLKLTLNKIINDDFELVYNKETNKDVYFHKITPYVKLTSKKEKELLGDDLYQIYKQFVDNFCRHFSNMILEIVDGIVWDLNRDEILYNMDMRFIEFKFINKDNKLVQSFFEEHIHKAISIIKEYITEYQSKINMNYLNEFNEQYNFYTFLDKNNDFLSKVSEYNKTKSSYYSHLNNSIYKFNSSDYFIDLYCYNNNNIIKFSIDETYKYQIDLNNFSICNLSSNEIYSLEQLLLSKVNDNPEIDRIAKQIYRAIYDFNKEYKEYL